MRLGRQVTLVALLGVAACQDATRPDAASPAFEVGRPIPGQYIVVFRNDVQDPPGLARQLAAANGGTVLRTYGTALKGFAAQLPDQAVTGLANNPNVAYVEQDRDVRLFDTQSNPPWGLDRVDQRDLPLDNAYTYANDGTGVNIYVLDTGIRDSHVDFGGRAQFIPNGSSGDFVGDAYGAANGAEDCHGHGTHVAGSAAGATYGVAKGAAIWAGRVVNCSGGGSVSMAIAAVDWITADGQLPASVNMSLGYGNVQSLRDAVEASVAAGFNYAVAAGNGNFAGVPQDACNESPAGAPNAVTVGATDISDREASFSNYGTCVDILAPGVSILSAFLSSDNATATMSGTSMATPHVAGAMALVLADNPSATPSQVSAALVGNATSGEIRLHRSSRRNGTPNLLLYTGFLGGDTPPTASFTFSCDNTTLTCNFDGSGSSDDGTIVSYDWDFGDGGMASGVSPQHTYAAAGTFTVLLTVTDDGGQTGADSQDVTVGDVPCTPRGRSGKCT